MLLKTCLGSHEARLEGGRGRRFEAEPKGTRKVARGIGHGRHVGRQKQHRRNHLLCGLIEAVREEMGDVDSSQVDCGDGGRRGLQHLQLKAVEEARKHGLDSCRPDARPIERRTYVLISTVQYHWSCN